MVRRYLRDYYDKDMVMPEPIRFEMLDDHLTFTLVLGLNPGDERDPQPLVRSVLDPLLRRYRMSIVHFQLQEALSPPEAFVLHTSIGFNTRERTLPEL